MQLRFPRLLLVLLGALTIARANDADVIAAVRAADDERVAAIIAADATRLDAIFSEQLHYGHSSGKNDTKASYVDALVNHKTVYLAIDYQQREFIPAGPGAVLVRGRALVKAGPPGQALNNDLNFLAVFREENGKWRFLAWQSCKNPPAAPANQTPPSAPAAPSVNLTVK